MQLIDTHTHLFSSQFDEDRTLVVQQAIGQGVQKMFLPNIDQSTVEGVMALHQEFPEHCFPMLGLHPTDVKEDHQVQLDFLHEFIANNRSSCYGIGETGLDYYWDTTYIDQQKESLHQHAQWAKEFDLPIILHTRDSFEDTLAIMQQEQNGELKGIFHCFSGSLEQAQQVIDLGFLMGIGGVITFKNSGEEIREVLRQVDIKHLVLETDSPYLTPHPYRGKRNESAYLPLIANQLAEIKGISVDEVAEATTANASALFRVKNKN